MEIAFDFTRRSHAFLDFRDVHLHQSGHCGPQDVVGWQLTLPQPSIVVRVLGKDSGELHSNVYTSMKVLSLDDFRPVILSAWPASQG